MFYVTFDHDTRALTGAYLQELQPDHATCYIQVDADQHMNWTAYRVNEARDDLELLPPAVPQPLSEAEVVAMYERAVDEHIDAGARSYGYMSILTAISYAEEPAVPQFQTEGQALRAWRSLCYAKCHEVLAAVKAQERGQPTVAQLLSEMPAIGLPAPGPLAA